MSMIILFLMQASVVANAPDSTHTIKVEFEFDKVFFSANDEDGDGELNLDEFYNALEERMDTAMATNPAAQKKFTLEKRAVFREKVASPMFRSLDRNSDRHLSLEEIKSSSSTIEKAPTSAK